MAWQSVEEAVDNIEALSEFDLELVEQPLPRHQYEGLALLRQHCAVPIMVDESLWVSTTVVAPLNRHKRPALNWHKRLNCFGQDNRECAAVIRAGAADVGNVYVHESGGLLAASRNLCAHALLTASIIVCWALVVCCCGCCCGCGCSGGGGGCCCMAV
jgi:L-alanine-DL-glutamate epimerase-like enolase superfamily enzyme